jgi:uncharacterized damage-inducible protein DinB
MAALHATPVYLSMDEGAIMQPGQATFARELLLRGFEMEMKTTRRVLEAIPEDKCDYRPETRLRSAYEMAWHIVSSEIWFLESVLHGLFGPAEARMPVQIKTIRDIIDYYDRSVPPLVEKVRTMKPEELTRDVDFFGVVLQPAVKYLSTLTAHTVHHRAQVALYIRMVGGKVPSIYGGSLDQPFTAA